MKEAPSTPPGRRRAWAVVALAWIVLLHGALWWIELAPEPRRLWGDERTYLRWAGELAAGGEWRPDPPLWPPLYARVLAPLIGRGEVAGSGNPEGGSGEARGGRSAGEGGSAGVGGSGGAGGSSGAGGAGGATRFGFGERVAVGVVQTALLIAAALALRGIGRSLGAPAPAPEVAAAAMLGFPPLAAYVHYLWPEVLHLALLLFAVWVLVSRRRGAGWMIALGLALGLAVAAKSLLGPVLPLLLVPLLLERTGAEPWRRTVLRGAGRAALAAVACAAVLAPVAIADQRRLGEPAARGTALFNLWVGLEERSRTEVVDPVVEESLRRYRAAAPDAAGRRAFLEREIAETVRERGLPALLAAQLGRQCFRLFDRDGFLTAQLPGGAIHDRGVGYRRPPPALAAALRWTSWASWAALLALAPLGFVLLPPRAGWRWRWLPAAFVAYNLGLFLLLHVKTRYRLQLLPFLLLWAAVAAVGLWRRRRGAEGDGAGEMGEPVPRAAALAAAVACSALLLWLAFGG